MSSTNKTTNYELSQFVETDKPAWLTDYNGDMRKLDTALKAVSDVADGASGGISSLTDRMTAAEGAITTNANDIDALEARADALEAGAQSTAGTIAAIQTEQTAQNLGIEAATELGYNLARPYDSASTYAVGAYVLFQNTLYKCITAVSTGEVFDPTKWLAIKATDEISAGGYTLPIASASQLGGVKVGDNLEINQDGVLSTNGLPFSINSNPQITVAKHPSTNNYNTVTLGVPRIIKFGNICVLTGEMRFSSLTLTTGSNIAEATMDFAQYAPNENSVYSIITGVQIPNAIAFPTIYYPIDSWLSRQSVSSYNVAVTFNCTTPTTVSMMRVPFAFIYSTT